jgi:phosphoribosylformimino-5-aminoimidazole carboxamide ribotide isomerase
VQIVPVLDLLRGQVVRARRGDRTAYRPIETPIVSGSDPVAVARGLLGLHPFHALYVADLDAIERRGDNASALRRLRAAFPLLALWVDNGAASDAEVAALARPDIGAEPILGSETQRDEGLIARCGDLAILSLDFRADQFQGPAAILAQPASWPRRVIVMTLARVGSGAGPDFDRLAAIREAAPNRSIYAAGGVRDAADCRALQRMGVAGVLAASALHDGRLTSSDLRALHGPA